MTIATRLATFKDYNSLSLLFNLTNAEYQQMRPLFYRTVHQVLPPRWKFNAMVAAKKIGLLKGISMIVALDNTGHVIGAVYNESIERPARSWQMHERSANIETLCVPRLIVQDDAMRVRVKETLVGAALSWAKATGHGYITVRDHVGCEENARVYEGFGLKPDYITYGSPTVV